MQDRRERLSAHELNKYAYCPYQWYYERVYGRKELRRLYRERNEALGLSDEMQSAFNKGNAFHDAAYARLKRNRLLKKAVVCLLLLLILAGVCFVLGSGDAFV